jgi:hypothetical protein
MLDFVVYGINVCCVVVVIEVLAATCYRDPIVEVGEDVVKNLKAYLGR